MIDKLRKFPRTEVHLLPEEKGPMSTERPEVHHRVPLGQPKQREDSTRFLKGEKDHI